MKRFVAMILIVAVIACGGYAFAAGGGASDPLISLSYLLEMVRTAINSAAENKVDEQVGALIDGYIQRLENSSTFQSSDMSHAKQFTDLLLEDGVRLELGKFACFLPTEGKMVLRMAEGDVIDISTGEMVTDGTLLELNHKYFAVENAKAWIHSYSQEAVGFIDGYYSIQETVGFDYGEMFYDMFDHWGAEYVYELYTTGIVNGVDEHRFEPDTKVTRGMLVTILGRVYGIDAGLYTASGFEDVSIDKWYGPYVAWAQDTGIVEGYEDGTFKPDTNITREQMALIFTRFANYLGIALVEEDAEPFADENKISPWAADAVLYAQRTGLINGKDGNRFDPKGTATRAEMCTVTSRFLDKARETMII